VEAFGGDVHADKRTRERAADRAAKRIPRTIGTRGNSSHIRRLFLHEGSIREGEGLALSGADSRERGKSGRGRRHSLAVRIHYDPNTGRASASGAETP
jgi:hypothetical protein